MKWYINCQFAGQPVRTFRITSNDIIEAIRAAKNQAAQLWGCKPNQIQVFEAGSVN